MDAYTLNLEQIYHSLLLEALQSPDDHCCWRHCRVLIIIVVGGIAESRSSRLSDCKAQYDQTPKMSSSDCRNRRSLDIHWLTPPPPPPLNDRKSQYDQTPKMSSSDCRNRRSLDIHWVTPHTPHLPTTFSLVTLMCQPQILC